MLDISSWPKTRIGKFTLIVASNLDQIKQGLQFTSQLPPNHLMLFPNIAENCFFHTVNCSFPLDIISLNSENKVLDIWAARTNMKQIGPTPQKTAKVIEAPLGWANKMNIQIGSDLMRALKS